MITEPDYGSEALKMQTGYTYDESTNTYSIYVTYLRLYVPHVWGYFPLCQIQSAHSYPCWGCYRLYIFDIALASVCFEACPMAHAPLNQFT